MRSTYDVLPSPVNLVSCEVKKDNNCRYGEVETMKHTLSNCKIIGQIYLKAQRGVHGFHKSGNGRGKQIRLKNVENHYQARSCLYRWRKDPSWETEDITCRVRKPWSVESCCRSEWIPGILPHLNIKETGPGLVCTSKCLYAYSLYAYKSLSAYSYTRINHYPRIA